MVELHLPVMEKEVLYYLACRPDGIYVDATVGDGGHAEAICEKLTADGRLIGIDWDDAALKRAGERLARFGEKVTLIREDYTRLEALLKEAGYSAVDGILIDLGASTIQLMDPGRGFSFHREGELDMRMDRRRSLTAKKIINEYPVDNLAEIFFRYGEERWSKRVAEAVARKREQKGPIADSRQLAEIVKEAIPARYRRRGGHPARRVFQALRLAVNSELENIAAVLPQAVKCLVPKGRICIISYHSLEDRLIKRYFREQATGCSCSSRMPCVCGGEAVLKVLTSRAVKPSEEEVKSNPRARSARIRAAERKKTALQKEGE